MGVGTTQAQIVDAPDARAEPFRDLTYGLAMREPRQRLGSTLVIKASSRVRPMAGDRMVDLLLSPNPHQWPQKLHPQHRPGTSYAHAVCRSPAFPPGRKDLDRGAEQVAGALDDVAVDHRYLHGR